MKTLVERFRARRPDLEIQIRGRPLPDALRRLRGAVDELQQEYLDGLVEAQSRVAVPLLHVLRHSLSGVETVRHVGPDESLDPTVVGEAPALLRGVGRVLISGALAVCTAAILIEIGGFLAYAALTTFALSVVVELWSAVDRSRRQAMQQAARRAVRAERGPGHAVFDGPALLDQLERSLSLVDEVVPDEEQLRQRPAPDHAPPAPPKALLEFLQDLLEDRRYDDSKVALQRIQGLPALLRRLGIEALDYSEDAVPEDRSEELYFEFEPDLSGEARAPQGLAPALLRGEEILLRGRVRRADGIAS